MAQLREAYQSQLAIQQNDLMRVFTIVTVLFLPLTLITGWFGMNFVNMPELQSEWGYPPSSPPVYCWWRGCCGSSGTRNGCKKAPRQGRFSACQKVERTFLTS